MPVGKAGQWYSDAQEAVEAELASATKTATGTSPVWNVEDADSLLAKLVVSAASGTLPTLDVTLETTVDGTNFYTVGTFAQKTAAGSEGKAFSPLGTQARWQYAISGTLPSLTFEIDATERHDR